MMMMFVGVRWVCVYMVCSLFRVVIRMNVATQPMLCVAIIILYRKRGSLFGDQRLKQFRL